MIQKAWICMDCGKVIYFPSVEPKLRKIICTFCRKPILEEIPEEHIKASEVLA